MHKLVINGGKKLHGEVTVSGAKNAALPIIAATLLAKGRYCIGNMPKLMDICTFSELMEQLGIKTECSPMSRFCSVKSIKASEEHSEDNFLCYINTGADSFEAPYETVKKMRASILVLGPLLARRGRAKVSLPGGCAIGERPVDLHLSALEMMGAEIKVEHGYIDATCKRLKGADINFRTVTVTGTENILMAATLAEGETVLRNAAKEPEVVDLANFLIAMGAKITGAGTDCIRIQGVDALHAADYDVMPDRIEAGTFMCAIAGVGGKGTINKVPVKSMEAVIDAIRSTGAVVTVKEDGTTVEVESSGILKPVNIITQPYPGFPTDMQAQFMAIMTKAEGTSVVDETIFENRFMHVSELKRMSANISIKQSKAEVKGVKKLSGAPVMASDLRASAGLVIAALMAEGTGEVLRVYHLDRGYDRFEVKLQGLGADISRQPSGV